MKSSIALFFVVITLFGVGLLMVFNTTSAELLDRGREAEIHSALIKQFIASILGAASGVAVYLCGYKRFLKWTPYFFYLGVVSLVLVFLPKIGQQINGSHRWINVFGISLQPSEFMKFIIPLYAIHKFLEEGSPRSFTDFYKSQAIFVFPIALILVEPDNGSAAIVVATLMTLYFIFSIRWRYWLIPTMVLVTLGGFAALKMHHVSDRIRVYLNPESDLLGKGHQPYQAKIATGSGGLTGRGLGESMQKLNYLPEARSDYIAAIYAEEFGFIGIVFLLTLFMAFGGIGFYIATRACDLGGYYSAVILTFLVTFQAFLNLGVVSGLLPSKGTNLPLFSQGGSSLIANFTVIALLINIAMQRQRHTLEAK